MCLRIAYEKILFLIMTLYYTIDLGTGFINIPKINILNYSLSICILIFIISMYLRKDINILILLLCLIICILSVTFFLYPQNINYVKLRALRFTLYCLSSILIVIKINDLERFKEGLCRYGYFLFLIGIFYFIKNINTFSASNYNGTLSHIFAVSNVLILENYWNNKKKRDLIFLIIGFLLIILVGQRNSILVIISYLIFKILNYFSTQRSWFKKILVVIVIGTLSLNIETILIFIQKLFMYIGINSRSLNLILEGNTLNYLSGRDLIYGNIYNAILDRPILGYGLFGDSDIMNKLGYDIEYSHSIIFEILASFGLIIGGTLLFTLFIILIKTIFSKNDIKNNLTLIFISIALSSLLFNGSFISSIEFWIFISIYFKRRNIKENLNEKYNWNNNLLYS